MYKYLVFVVVSFLTLNVLPAASEQVGDVGRDMYKTSLADFVARCQTDRTPCFRALNILNSAHAMNLVMSKKKLEYCDPDDDSKIDKMTDAQFEKRQAPIFEWLVQHRELYSQMAGDAGIAAFTAVWRCK